MLMVYMIFFAHIYFHTLNMEHIETQIGIAIIYLHTVIPLFNKSLHFRTGQWPPVTQLYIFNINIPPF